MPHIRQPSVSKPRYYVVPKYEDVVAHLKGQNGHNELADAEALALSMHMMHGRQYTVIQMRPVAVTEFGL